MKKSLPIRQSLGIDVSKDSLQVCISNLEVGQRVRVIATTKFDNIAKGHEKLWAWIKKHRMEGVDFHVVMEATGVYHESVTYFLHQKGLRVCVILPTKSKGFFKSLNTKSKTDEIDAKVLAQFGLERTLEAWQPASQNLRRLKRLCRERIALQQQQTAILNQRHARDFAHLPEKDIQKRSEKLIAFIKKQLKEVEQEIQKTIQSDTILKEKVDKICTVKGLGLVTVATIIAETDGFTLFTSKAQVVSFSGYDVVKNESGTSIKGMTKISRKGNSHIRRALYFPAITAVKHEKNLADLFERTFEKSRIKMKAYVAVQRKLLVLIYTLFKTNAEYDPQHHFKQLQKNRQELSPA